VPTFRRSFSAAALGLALVLSGCGGHPTVHRQIAIVPATGTAGASWEPTTITVSKDDNVILAVGNPTPAVHGFSIEGYGIQTEIPPGGSEVKIRATHPGTFKIYSQLEDIGQVATLVVQ
jgi:hypothetical protein